MKKTALVAVLCAVSAIADRAVACDNDSQCKGDRVCTGGQCVDPPLRGGPAVAPPAGAQGPTPAAPPPPGGAPPAGVTPPAAAPQAGWPPGGYPLAAGWPPPAEPATRRRVGLLVTGSILGGLGVIGLVVGGLTFAAGSEAASLCNSGYYDPLGYDSSYDTCDDDEAMRDVGAGVMVGSGIALAGSIPLIIVGARKVPVEREHGFWRGVTLEIRPRHAGAGIAGTF